MLRGCRGNPNAAYRRARDSEEDLRRIQTESGSTITAAVRGFLTEGISPQTTFELEKELERLLREAGRQILEAVFDRLEPEEPESLPKHFAQQQQEYSRKEEESNNRGGIGTRFGTIQLRRFMCEPLQESREDAQRSFSPLELLLHSAAKLRSKKALPAARKKAYRKAYNYLNAHQEWMDYAAYRRQGLPIGSGVTEAACKTVFTQRFKESGMTWKLDGGQTILDLHLPNSAASGTSSTVPSSKAGAEQFP